jgi:hypothetical protein
MGLTPVTRVRTGATAPSAGALLNVLEQSAA